MKLWAQLPPTKALAMDVAQVIAQEALAKCRADGYQSDGAGGGFAEGYAAPPKLADKLKRACERSGSRDVQARVA